MPDQREQALSYLRLHGPSLPVQVAKALNTNILFASAVLSELSSKKHVLVSHAAIGGSKVYFLKGQERRLGDKLYPTLKGKPKEAYELLRDRKVVRDKAMEPWQRIALRELKDFAVPLTVTFGDEAELFWKFHMLSDDAAKPLVEQIMGHEKEEVEVPQEEPKEEAKPAEPEAKEPEKPAEPEPEKEEPTPEPEPEPEGEEEVEEEKESEKAQPDMQELVRGLKEEILKELRPKLEKKLKEEMKQETIIKPKAQKLEGKFYTRIREYLENNMIEVVKEEMIKKDKEFDFIVRIPSPFGQLNYYLKARDKKAISEADISQAHSEGQMKRMPTILLVTGKMSKKALSFTEHKLQGQVVVKEL